MPQFKNIKRWVSLQKQSCLMFLCCFQCG